MLKQGTSYAFARAAVLLKDIDASGRTVQFYGSAFDNVDSDGDRVIKGAYAKTILENGPAGANRIKHLRQHETRTIIGKMLELKEDSIGLLCTSVLADNADGNDALALYELDLLEHSIGYQVVKQTYDETTGINDLNELKLREVSAVTWGANADTPLVGIKGYKEGTATEASLARVQDRQQKLIKALRYGHISDHLGHQLADELEALDHAYKGLISLTGTPPKPAEPATLEADEPSGKKALNSFLKLI